MIFILNFEEISPEERSPLLLSNLANTYDALSVVGFRHASCNISAITTIPPKMANPNPKLPPSLHLPNTCVTKAPANTPTMFMIP